MKKLIYFFTFSIFILFLSVIIFLSTSGIETSKFNNLIIEQIKKQNKQVNVGFKKIKIKLDLKKFNLFLITQNPKIQYEGTNIPIKEVRVYLKLSSIIKNKPQLNRIVISNNQVDISTIKKIITRSKPSNLKSFFLNNINGGILNKSLIDLKFKDTFVLEDYKINGSFENIEAKLKENKISKVNFNFIFDKNLILINSIRASYEGINIKNGSIDVKRSKITEIEGNLNSFIDLNEIKINNIEYFKNSKFLFKNKINLKGEILHSFNISLSETLEVLNYKYNAKGKNLYLEYVFNKKIKSNFFENDLKKLTSKKMNVEFNLNKKERQFLVEGEYSTNNSEFKKYKIINTNDKDSEFDIDLDLSEKIFIKFLNFKNNPKKKSNIKTKFYFKKNSIFFETFKFSEENSLIEINNLEVSNKIQLKKLKNIKVKTYYGGNLNNDFNIKFGKKIIIQGKTYDATFLLEQLGQDTKTNLLNQISRKIEIKLKTIKTKSLIPLNDFNLLGVIERGEFAKISSKSEFSQNKFMDITLKKDENNNKLLEVYSDLPKALLADYKIFDGINEGKLLFNSVIGKNITISKLSIENFKVLKAPAFATLLTLADLGGIADLLSGEGMSFDSLEIDLEEDKSTTTIKEILALGPSVSMHMEGYLEKKTGLVSLKGTLVPAKTLNNLISKIPVVGNILVGEQAGEGVFGVSFKVKGLPGKTKTTVNPVKTLTPRFITRALEKMKKN